MLKKWTLPGVHKYPKTQIWCIFTSLTLFIHKIKEGRKTEAQNLGILEAVWEIVMISFSTSPFYL